MTIIFKTENDKKALKVLAKCKRWNPGPKPGFSQ